MRARINAVSIDIDSAIRVETTTSIKTTTYALGAVCASLFVGDRAPDNTSLLSWRPICRMTHARARALSALIHPTCACVTRSLAPDQRHAIEPIAGHSVCNVAQDGNFARRVGARGANERQQHQGHERNQRAQASRWSAVHFCLSFVTFVRASVETTAGVCFGNGISNYLDEIGVCWSNWSARVALLCCCRRWPR